MKDAHVLITGASGGVGITTARTFLEAGAKVSMQYNSNISTLSSLLSEFPNSAVAVKAAATAEDEVSNCIKQAINTFGPVTTLAVCHGIWPEEDVGVKDMTLARWRNTISVNLDGTFLFCREYLKQLEQAVKSGAKLRNVAIVLVGSTAGKFGEAWHADYSVTKSAMMYGLTLSLKNEIVKIHPRGRVNTVSPGWIRTPMAERAMQDPSLLYQALASSPLKKVSEPADIAQAILFLSSETMSGNITGVSLDVNAGMEDHATHRATLFLTTNPSHPAASTSISTNPSPTPTTTRSISSSSSVAPAVPSFTPHTPQSRKSTILDTLLGGSIGYLESCPGACEVRLCTRAPAKVDALLQWESQHVPNSLLPVFSSVSSTLSAPPPLTATTSLSNSSATASSSLSSSSGSFHRDLGSPHVLPEDLSGLYSITNGLIVQWSARFGKDVMLLGEMHINGLDRLTRVTDGNGMETGGNTRGIVPPETNVAPQLNRRWWEAEAGKAPNSLNGIPHAPGPAFILHDCSGIGRVCLCYPLADSTGRHWSPEVWLQDLRGVWYPLAKSFSGYFRLMIAHLGLIGWQAGMIEIGMPQPTMDWLGFYAPERASLTRRVRAAVMACGKSGDVFQTTSTTTALPLDTKSKSVSEAKKASPKSATPVADDRPSTATRSSTGTLRQSTSSSASALASGVKAKTGIKKELATENSPEWGLEEALSKITKTRPSTASASTTHQAPTVQKKPRPYTSYLGSQNVGGLTLRDKRPGSVLKSVLGR